MNWHGLRVALVGPLAPPAGGMANQTRQLADLLAGEGACVELVQVNAPYRPEWIARIRGARALFRLLPYLARLWRASGRADVMHVMANSGWSWDLFAAPAIWIGSLRGVPVIVNYRGGEADVFLARAAARVSAALRKAVLLVVPSGYLREVFARHGMQGRIVPNIIDLERFSSVGRSSDFGAPHLVVARNLEPIYGIDNALQAFAIVRRRYPKASLVVAGSGPSEADLKALAQTLGICEAVTFTGQLDRLAMQNLYKHADIALNPSTVDNMPNSVLEALACGLPVVSTNVGGVPFIVTHGETALLVSPGQPEEMAEAILRVIEDVPLRARMVAKGLQAVQQYSWAAVRLELAQAYEYARSQRGGGASLSVGCGRGHG